MLPKSPFLQVAITVVGIVPILTILMASTTSPPPTCPASTSGLDGHYKAMALVPPLTEVEAVATIEVVGGLATTRERKWLEREEEGVRRSCWLQGPDGRVALTWREEEVLGLVSENGANITLLPSTTTPPPSHPHQHLHPVAQLLRISGEEAQALDAKNPVAAPPSTYPKRPPGRLVFLSGPPGAGKSSLAAAMALQAAYVYYEGDGFLFGVNPYVPPAAEQPSVATGKQAPLVGPGMHARRDAVAAFGQQFDVALGDYSRVDREGVEAFLTAMCEDIQAERARLGGDWAVAFAIPDLASRELVRRLLGPELVFVVLELSQELQAERVEGRDGEDRAGMLEDIFQVYQPAGPTEDAAIPFKQTTNATVQENVESVLGLINEYYTKQLLM